MAGGGSRSPKHSRSASGAVPRTPVIPSPLSRANTGSVGVVSVSDLVEPPWVRFGLDHLRRGVDLGAALPGVGAGGPAGVGCSHPQATTGVVDLSGIPIHDAPLTGVAELPDPVVGAVGDCPCSDHQHLADVDGAGYGGGAGVLVIGPLQEVERSRSGGVAVDQPVGRGGREDRGSGGPKDVEGVVLNSVEIRRRPGASTIEMNLAASAAPSSHHGGSRPLIQSA